MEPSDGSSGTNNISDVLDVLWNNIVQDNKRSMNKGRIEGPSKNGKISMDIGELKGIYIKIVEQPASKALRFRYECEGRSAGSIPGVNSIPENKTYPTVKIEGYKGPAVVIVSCVTKESPYRPHPHNLVGRDGCKNGICCVEVNNDSMTQSFDHLGIQCVKRKDIEEALTARETLRVDPFQTGFSHKTQPGSIDLNSVRLCFQAFLKTDNSKKLWPLHAVVSDIIYDKKALCDLAICKLSHCSAPVIGGQEMILLCEKVAKEDISIRFYEEGSNGEVAWEGKADFSPTQVHKQVAISFKTPRYKTIKVDSPVQVYIQLRRTSDGELSEPQPFLLTPLESGVMSDELPHKIVKRPRKEHKVAQPIATQPLLRDSPSTPSTTFVKREAPEGSPNPYGVCQLPPFSPSPRTHSPLDCNIPGPSYPVQVYEFPYTPNIHQGPYTFTQDAGHSPSNNLYPGAIGCPRSPGSPLMTTLTPVAPTHPDRVSPYPSAYSGGLEPIPNGEVINCIQFDCPMEPITINSRELPDYDLTDANLSQTMSDSLSLSCEVKKLTAQENMTDSLTNIANTTYDQMVGSESTNK